MAWGQSDKEKWLSEQSVKRSYHDEVVRKIHALGDRFEIVQYGKLSHGGYPLFLLKSRQFLKRPTILITGGVHGYETSGVHGALAFLERGGDERFNIVCAPCVSPWAYETVNRWSTKALDPNRSFRADTPVEESRLLMEAVAPFDFAAHFDLHETTDTDNSVFRPALEARDGITIEWSEIPDGFYAVGDTENPQAEFQRAVIDAVRKVTHIAPADAAGKIIGERLEQEGVINYPLKKLSLCASITRATHTTTTEVYPDSPKVTPEICVDAQVAAIRGGLDYLSAHL